MKTKLVTIDLLGLLLLANTVQAQTLSTPTGAIPVTVENFIRAESDLYFGAVVKKMGLANSSSLARPR